ncbi:leucine-rich repeat-containing protein 19-like [Embiotoca jacksoni]|uniref:leucine-rich repeat-containing protein 19-like n=1 Tax=Embiotoca jacksoni TaxID=100190 RepID=UPI003703E655
MMKRCRQLLMLWLTAVSVMNILGNTADAVVDEPLVKNLTDKLLQVIPHNDNNSTVTTLLIEGNRITLNKADQLALASYPTLAELHLDGNMVTAIPAQYFSVVPDLRVLSLARNKIISLNPEAFSGLDVLREVDLSHNLLTRLPAQLIKGLKELKMLNLQENPWNCSCLLLSSIREIQRAHVTINGRQKVFCASPVKQAGAELLKATALCSPSTPPPSTPTAPQTSTPAHSKQSGDSSTTLKTTPSSGRNHSLSKDQTPARGNSWKFTVCVAALALTTCMLIMCAIKGPSWYKLFHNYRHRRLQQEDDREDFVSTVFSETGGHLTQQTFSFQQQKEKTEEEEEEEDEYFEDPYIKREE